jgi:hypothetical protein
MPAITRPAKAFSFADYARNNPRGPLPGDRLDVQIENLIQAIHSTQQALADIRRDDGKLRNNIVGTDQLAVEIKHTRAEMETIEDRSIKNVERAIGAASQVTSLVRDVELRARDAESAAISAAQFLSAVNTAKDLVAQKADTIAALDVTADTWATDSENWANWSQAQATNAMTSEQQAAAWAEYLAGPVVDSTQAPAYIAGTPWGHGLYYQPVQGYGGNAGLWSAKWWAIYVSQIVAPWNFYYLGAWPSAPNPGSTNPATGLKVPNPLAPGSFYYDTTTGQLMIWDGGQWKSPYVLAPAYVGAYVYVATAGQKVFSGVDSNGKTPIVGQSSSDVHLNGVRLVAVTDYTINAGTSTLTLNIAASINSIVQWDLLVPTSQLVPGAVNAFKTVLAPVPDGTNKIFTMTYTNPSTGQQPVNATAGAQLQVALDGVIQEPGPDYTGTGNTLTMAVAPPLGSHFWAVWFANATLTT